MINVEELVGSSHRRIRSHLASSLFLNGPPGSGKSHAIACLIELLSQELTRVVVFGPYQTTPEQACSSAGIVGADAVASGLVDEWGMLAHDAGFEEALLHLQSRLGPVAPMTLLVVFDIHSEASFADLDTFASLCLMVRYVEHVWRHRSVRLHMLVSGFWSHPRLARYCQEHMVSFPYTVGENYVVWEAWTWRGPSRCSVTGRPERLPLPQLRFSGKSLAGILVWRSI